MPHINKDKTKLRNALKEFSEKQKQVLFEKVDEGFSGWDFGILTDDLELRLLSDAKDIRDLVMENGLYQRKLIHIANYAMFLYHLSLNSK